MQTSNAWSKDALHTSNTTNSNQGSCLSQLHPMSAHGNTLKLTSCTLMARVPHCHRLLLEDAHHPQDATLAMHFCNESNDTKGRCLLSMIFQGHYEVTSTQFTSTLFVWIYDHYTNTLMQQWLNQSNCYDCQRTADKIQVWRTRSVVRVAHILEYSCGCTPTLN